MRKRLKIMMAGTTVFWGASVFNNPVQAIVFENVPTAQTSNDNEHEGSSIYRDTTEAKNVEGNLTTVGEIAEDQNKHNVLGVAGMFHIFSKETNISADTNGNIATKTYHYGNEFGTRGESHNLTATKDVNYLEEIEDMGANAFRAQDQTVVVGKNSNNVQKHGDQVFVNGKRLDHLHAKDLRKEDEIHPRRKYIDIEREFKKLELNSSSFARGKQSEGIHVNFDDMNNRYIDVSNSKKDEFNNIYVDLDAQYLMAPQPITIKGISDEKEAPTIIINIRNSAAQLTAGMQTRLIYQNSATLSPTESHPRRNKVLWNFGKELRKLDVSSGYMMGSILAPNAVVTLNVNVDGNIVAEVVNVKGGESHRWDLQPSKPKIPRLPDNEFIVPPPLPEDPNKDKEEPKPGNPGEDEEKPKTEDPGKEKSKPEEPKPGKPGGEEEKPKADDPGKEIPKSENPAPPARDEEQPKVENPQPENPADPNKPSISDKPVTPNETKSSKAELVKQVKKEASNKGISNLKTVRPAVNVTAAATSVRKSNTNQNALPQAGEDPIHLTIVGLALNLFALITGVFTKSKRN